MNWYEIFYWLTVADNARTAFGWFAGIMTASTMISTLAFFACFNTSGPPDSGQPLARKWLWWSAPIAIFFWLALVLTPSKRDSLLIIAGGGTLQFLTTDSTAQKIPAELSAFVLTELRAMGEEASIDLGVASTKSKILDEAKNMTTNELLERMKVDSSFRQIILE